MEALPSSPFWGTWRWHHLKMIFHSNINLQTFVNQIVKIKNGLENPRRIRGHFCTLFDLLGYNQRISGIGRLDSQNVLGYSKQAWRSGNLIILVFTIKPISLKADIFQETVLVKGQIKFWKSFIVSREIAYFLGARYN